MGSAGVTAKPPATACSKSAPSVKSVASSIGWRARRGTSMNRRKVAVVTNWRDIAPLLKQHWGAGPMPLDARGGQQAIGPIDIECVSEVKMMRHYVIDRRSVAVSESHLQNSGIGLQIDQTAAPPMLVTKFGRGAQIDYGVRLGEKLEAFCLAEPEILLAFTIVEGPTIGKAEAFQSGGQ